MPFRVSALKTVENLWKKSNKVFITGVAALTASVLVLSIGVAAHSATGSVSSVSLTTVSDGTAPFDADNSPGNDASANNGVLRTMDYVTYRWDYSVATSGDVTFKQVLPAGMRWDTSSTANCTQGASAISADKRTITCTLPNLVVGSGNYQVKAQALATANGAVMSSSVVSGSATSNTVDLTISATPKLILEHMFGGATRTTLNGQTGYAVQTIQNISMPINTATGKGVRGLEGFNGSTFTFTITPPASPAGAVIQSCSHGSPDGSRQPWTVAGSVYSVPNAGTWTCDQPGGPGTPVNVTITGVDTSLSYWPTKYVTNTNIPATIAYVAAGGVAFWYPESAMPTGSVYTVKTQATGFDPVSESGESNYGDSYSGNQQPGAACTTVFPSNCATTTVNLRDIVFSQWVFQNIPGATNSNSGDGAIYSNQTVRFSGTTTSGQFNPPFTNLQHCYTWNNEYWNVPAAGFDPDARWEVEYGTHTYANDDARRAADCGVEGDGAAGWFSSPAAAGGADKVTAVRFRMLNTVTYGQAITTPVTLTRLPGVTAGTNMGIFMQYRSDQFAARKSTYNAETHNSFQSGNRGIAAEAKVANTVAWDQATTAPGTTRKVTVKPNVTNPYDTGTAVPARDVKVVVTLPNACHTYIAGSSTISPTVTPANVGADGMACTSDDVSPQKLTFSLGDVQSGTPIPDISFDVNVNITTAVPSTHTVTSVISSTSDVQREVLRTATSAVTVSSVASFAVTKQASLTDALNDVPFTYTIGWANRLTSSVGVTKIVDVLPYNGDARGTTGLGSLKVNSATSNTSGVTFQYTTMNSADLQSAIETDPSGDTGVVWVSTLPADGVTGVRVITPALNAGSTGNATLTVQASGLTSSSQIVNGLSAKAANLTSPIINAGVVSIGSSASTVAGNVYDDVNYSWSKDAADTGLGSVTVSYSGYKFGTNGIDDNGSGDDIAVSTPMETVTDADGNYSFNSVDPGKYSFTATTPTGYSVAATPSNPIKVGVNQTINTGRDFGFIVDIPDPVVANDNTSTGVNAAKLVDVLANDTVDESAIVSAVGSGSNGGTIVIAGDGKTVTYTPAPGFVGSETFTYTVKDKARQEATATVTVEVIGVPTPVDDFTVGVRGQGTTVNVLDNDEGSQLKVSTVTQSPNGSVTISEDGATVTFTPNAGFSGLASFTYTVVDSVGQTAFANVTVRVYPALVAVDDVASTGVNVAGVGSPVTIPLVGNDSGYDFAVTSHTQPAFGSITVDSNGDAVYTPDGTHFGYDSFTYVIEDSAGQSATATVTVFVSKPPYTVDDVRRVKKDQPTTVDVLENDEGLGLFVADVSGMSESVPGTPDGSAVVNADGTITFTPAAGFTGLATFTYVVTDSYGDSITGTVKVTVVAPPAASPITLMVAEGSSTDIQVMGYVDTPPGSTASVFGVSQPEKGTSSVVNASGTIRYVAESGANGNTSFTYTVVDDLGQTVTAAVDVTIVAVPTAVNDAVLTGHSAPVVVDVLGNDDGVELVVDSHTSPENGAVEFVEGQLTYVPAAGFSGVDSFQYTVVDVLGQTSTATVLVNVLSSLVADDVVTETVKDQPVQLFFELGAGEVLDSVSSSSNGSVEIRDDGTVWFTPSAGFVGVFTTSYTVRNQVGETTDAVIRVTVKDVKPAPSGPSEITPTETVGMLKSTGSAAVVTTVTILVSAAAVLTGTAMMMIRRRA